MEQFKNENFGNSYSREEDVQKGPTGKKRRSRLTKMIQSGVAGVLLAGGISTEACGGDVKGNVKNKGPRAEQTTSSKTPSKHEIHKMNPKGYEVIPQEPKEERIKKYGLPKIFKPQFDDLLSKSTNSITSFSADFGKLPALVKSQESRVVNGDDYDAFCKAVFEAGQRDFGQFSAHLEEASNADLLFVAKSAQQLADILERASYDLKPQVGSAGSDMGLTFNSNSGINTIDYFRIRICDDLLKIYEKRVSESLKQNFSF